MEWAPAVTVSFPLPTVTALWSPTVKLAAIAIGIVGGFMNLAIRRPAAQPA